MTHDQWSIYDTTDSYAVANPVRVEHLIVMVPKDRLVERGLALDPLMARRLGGSGGVARIALETMRNAYRELPVMSETAARGVGDAITQLVHLSMLDLAGIGTAVTQREALRDRIKQHVGEHLRDPQLTVDSIALALNCSRRQLYNAFAEEPDGVAGYILRRRLEGGRRYDNSRYLFTGIDEAWCVSMKGHALWGIKLPLKEGWTRVAETTASFGTSAEVMQVLEVMSLTLPITPDDVKRRYRELAKRWHSDLNPGNASVEERMKALTGAAEILTWIDRAALPRYTGATFAKEMNRQEFEVGATKFTVAMAMQVSEVNAADWIYAANFAGRSHGAFLAGYSGRIVQVDGEGDPVRAYDIGAVPRKVIDTGDHLYFLTDTRLYVLHSDALHALVDTVDALTT